MVQLMKFLRHRYFAYSLIELLVSTSIMLILISSALAGYIRYSDKQRLVAAAEKLEIGLKEAQNMARIGYLGNCDELAGINFATSFYGSGGIAYQIQALCQPAGSDALPTVNVDEDLLIDAPVDITFMPYNHLSDSVSFRLDSSRSNYYAIFEIDQGGGIKITYY
jgi:type II secretory pathway pseudopilin PulG